MHMPSTEPGCTLRIDQIMVRGCGHSTGLVGDVLQKIMIVWGHVKLYRNLPSSASTGQILDPCVGTVVVQKLIYLLIIFCTIAQIFSAPSALQATDCSADLCNLTVGKPPCCQNKTVGKILSSTLNVWIRESGQLLI